MPFGKYDSYKVHENYLILIKKLKRMERSSNEKRGNRGVYPIMHNMRTPIKWHEAASFSWKWYVLIQVWKLKQIYYPNVEENTTSNHELIYFIIFKRISMIVFLNKNKVEGYPNNNHDQSEHNYLANIMIFQCDNYLYLYIIILLIIVCLYTIMNE